MPQYLLMPALSSSMTEGNLTRWLVSEGAVVSSGDIIAEIESDKATVELEAPFDCTISKLLVAAGTDGVAIDRPLAVLFATGEALSQVPTSMLSNDDVPFKPVVETKDLVREVAPEPSATEIDRVLASPLAKVLARQNGVDLSTVVGTGPGRRVVKSDVLDRVQGLKSQTPQTPAEVDPVPEASSKSAPPRPAMVPMPWQSFEAIPHNSMRRAIARRLVESKQTVPHFYLTASIVLDELVALRERLNARPGASYKLSINDFIIKASALALRQVPEANAMWTDDAILRFKEVDISVAVAVEGGLITPVIRNAGNKGLETISNDMKELAVRARAGKLKPEEFQGGGFSISNLGMYGVESFSAIINPPQSCILAVGSAAKRTVVDETDAVVVRTVMSVTLSVDHRCVDGAVGARLLAAIKAAIEEPTSMLL